MKELVVNAKNAGGRLDKIIFKYLDKASPGFVYKMLRKKNITLNDKKASGSEIVNEGDSVKLFLSDETIAKFKSGQSVKAAKKAVPTAKKGISVSLKHLIVYEDENIIAVNKPAGLLTQKAAVTDISVNDFLLDHVPSDELFTPGAANRLDRNTSGIVLAGKNLNAQRELSNAIAGRDISKTYLAVVKGEITEAATKEAFLSKDADSNTVSITDTEVPGSVRIITGYRPVAAGNDLTLIEVDLITGRPHQIRAHMSHLGHPVAGDPKYGDIGLNEYLKEKYALKSQMLHAYRIHFASMKGILEYLNGKDVTADIPLMFRKVLEGENIWLPGAPEA